MKEELYKMFRRHYFFILASALIIPICFFIADFLQSDSLIKSNSGYQTLAEFCSDMQQTVKYIYYFAVVYIGADIFAGEVENGQIKLEILRRGRETIVKHKLIAACLFVLIFHILFWILNGIFWMIEYKSCMSGFADSELFIYSICSFMGYYVTFCSLLILSCLIGCYCKKVITVIATYMLWFIVRYVNAVIPMDKVLPEFVADKFINGIMPVYIRSFAVYITGTFIIYQILNIVSRRKDYA